MEDLFYMYMDSINSDNNFYALSSFGNVLICSDSISNPKTVTFPNGYNLDTNLAFKVVFVNGHNCVDDSTPMTLNGVPVVVNKFGTLIPLPIHEMDESGTTVYKSVMPNCVLEMYYTSNYDGNNNPAFVVIGNPVVLSSADYTIYADGKIGDEIIGTIKPYFSSSKPYGWLICDGGDGSGTSTGTETFDTTKYAELYAFLGTDKVPDLRECNLVGIGTNGSFTIGNHDTYTVGEFKDDQMQNINGSVKGVGRHYSVSITASGAFKLNDSTSKFYTGSGDSYNNAGFDFSSYRVARTGYDSDGTLVGSDVTHGKNMGVNYLIKAI